jgi:propionyl-CoA synthetase
MFSAPTAVRVLKKQDPAALSRHDLSSLRALFLAGEPLDEPTAKWIAEPGQAHHRQLLADRDRLADPVAICNGVEPAPTKFGSPGKAVYGYDVKLIDETTGEELKGPTRRAWSPSKARCRRAACRPCGATTRASSSTYWKSMPGKLVYSTFDWGIRDADGYFFILGRTDDVINVAGHRLGTREIEESISSHPNVAEVAVVGVADQLKGQVAMAFAVLKDPSKAGHAGRRAEARRRDHEAGRRAARRRGAAGARALRHRAAQDALGQAAAPAARHPGRVRACATRAT